MERVKLVLKPLALTCSVFLVGAFVGYRAGAFQRPATQPEAVATTDAQPDVTSQPAPQSPPAPTAGQLSPQHMMVGSKSMILLPADQLQPLTGSTITFTPLNTPTPPIPPAKP